MMLSKRTQFIVDFIGTSTILWLQYVVLYLRYHNDIYRYHDFNLFNQVCMDDNPFVDMFDLFEDIKILRKLYAVIVLFCAGWGMCSFIDFMVPKKLSTRMCIFALSVVALWEVFIIGRVIMEKEGMEAMKGELLNSFAAEYVWDLLGFFSQLFNDLCCFFYYFIAIICT